MKYPVILIGSFFFYLTGNAQTPDTNGDSLPPKEEQIFTKVEIEASFPGGDAKWRRFLNKNLDGYIPAKKRAPVGFYTVVVQFVVGKDGTLEDIKALTKHGYGMEEEVIRVIQLSPNWNPAAMNGRQVKAYRKQPVNFEVSEEERKTNKRDDE